MFAEKTMEAGASSGTSALTLGTAVPGWKTWRSQFATATDVMYFAENFDGTIWESGYGTLTYGGTDTITGRVLLLSSTGALVDFAGVTVYTASIPNGAAMKHLLNPLANTRPGWLRAGAMWLDYTIGLATTWVEKIATTAIAGGDAEKGRLDVAKKIFIASNAAPIRDTTTSGSTVGVNDRGYIVSHDTTAAVRVAALPAVATATEGFYVGIYADGVFPVFLDTNSTEAVDCAVVPPGRVVWVRCTGAKWVTQGGTNQNLIGRRQCITAGPLSSGLPNFLATVSGLALSTSNVAAATPLIVRASQGDSERWGLATGNVSFGTLTNTATNYLYWLVGVDGVLTGGNTTLVPVEQDSGTPATTNGQITFNITEMKCYLGNGSSAPAVYLVKAGKAVTSGGNVTAVSAYALNGRYDSGFTATLPLINVTLVKNHNLGSAPAYMVPTIVAECTTLNNGLAVGTTIRNPSLYGADSVSGAAPIALDLTPETLTLITANSAAFISNNSTNAATTLTAASWKYKILVDRGY